MIENKECYVIVKDKSGNMQRINKNARTKLHTWEIWDTKLVGTYNEYELSTELSELYIYEDSFSGKCGAFSTIKFTDNTLKYVHSDSIPVTEFRTGIDSPTWLYQNFPTYCLVGQGIKFLRKESKTIIQNRLCRRTCNLLL